MPSGIDHKIAIMIDKVDNSKVAGHLIFMSSITVFPVLQLFQNFLVINRIHKFYIVHK